MSTSRFKPLYIDLSGFRVTIFGGGLVGTRRAKYFLEAGAQVRVVAREFTNELKNMKNKVELIKAELKNNKDLIEKLVVDSDIIVIATNDSKLNNIINNIAKSKGKFINNATEALKGNIIVPFTGEAYNGLLKLAISTLGLSGIAARRARDKILNVLETDKELRTMLKSMMLLKKAFKNCIDDPKLRLPLYFIIENSREYYNAISRGDLKAAVEAAITIAEVTLDKNTTMCIRDYLTQSGGIK